MTSKLERFLAGGTVAWDRALVTDGLSPEAVAQITAVTPAAPDKTWVVIDHDAPAGSVAVAEQQKALLDWARRAGTVFRSGRGIGYALLLEAGFTPKETTRKGNSVTYFKQSEAIEDFLTAIGAPLAAMEIMNAKAEKDLRGSVNRRVNCDAANLDKAVDAAQVQLEAIATLEERGLLEELPDKLKEAVDLRVAHPEFTLTQLAELCNPPVSKSAFNHRLRKLVELSKR